MLHLILTHILALILSFAIGVDAKAANQSIIVKKMMPEPNYIPSKDNSDIEQLTDGIVLDFPIWSQKGNVGWHYRTPFKLNAGIIPGNNNNIQGTLRIHTAKGLYARVKVIRRVDVYSKIDPNHYLHIGEFHGNEDNWKDRKNHWLNVDLKGLGNELAIVIHANGIFAMIDEIEWIPKDSINVVSSETQPILEQEIIQDSTNRLKDFYTQPPPPITVGDTQLSKFFVWNEDPWGDLAKTPKSINNSHPVAIQIVGVRNEKESITLGIFNTMDDVNYSINISSCQDLSADVFEIGKVKKVLTASGKETYDPIVPINLSETVQFESKQVSYLWLSVNLSKLTKKHYETSLNISSKNSKFKLSVPLFIDIIDKEVSLNIPKTVNWSYSHNLPIWKQPDAVLNDLLEHRINVFVTAPLNIPQPDAFGVWDTGAERRLKNDLNLFKGKGQILLFVGWGPSTGRPKWFYNRADLGNDEKFNLIKTWVNKLSNYMQSQGFSYSDWAIYPVDEIHGEKIAFLTTIAQWIKDSNPNVRIYANPTQPDTGYASYTQLKSLEPLIDIWQPSYNYATGKGKQFFSEMIKPWWFYKNPRTPVKQSSPFSDYRLLGWRAWNIGSSGFGFWSYSDVRGNSAWDDFDGDGPDWAVVYEGETKPISSRRWEAFREGVEDYMLLKAVENKTCFPSSLTALKNNITGTDNLTSQLVNVYRQQMLSCLMGL